MPAITFKFLHRSLCCPLSYSFPLVRVPSFPVLLSRALEGLALTGWFMCCLRLLIPFSKHS